MKKSVSVKRLRSQMENFT